MLPQDYFNSTSTADNFASTSTLETL